MLLLLLAACGADPTPTPTDGTASQQAPQPGPPGGNQGPPGAPQPGGPGGPGPAPDFAALAAAEDLDSSWPADIDVAVTPGAPGECSSGAAWIPAGPFLMGSESVQSGRDERPVHVVTLSGYCLDLTEVTAGAFSAWLLAEGRSPAGLDPRHLGADGAVEAGREAHPAEGVTWEEARDYCASVGGALPTEAQWEKAARGGCELGEDPAACERADLKAYPWGDEAPTCELANHQLVGPSGPSLCRSDTHPVGTHGEPGPYGHRDLAGNVWEYVADYYHPALYAGERADPGGPKAGTFRVMRGGSWNTFSTNMRAANRFSDSVLGSAVGFRCAYPTVAAALAPIPPLPTVTLSGTVRRATGTLTGRRLYVTAFDALDTGPNGMPVPGHSPAAEVMMTPGGADSQAFSIEVPANAIYFLFSALDAGTGGQKEGYISSSSSGGFGRADASVDASTDVDGLSISLGPPPGSASGGPGGGGPPR